MIICVQHRYAGSQTYQCCTHQKGGVNMSILGHLEEMLLNGEITEEEYKERKAAYVETILELYVLGIIDKKQMQAKLNE